MTTYYRIPGCRIVHTRRNCPRMAHALLRSRGVDMLDRKPSHTTICDHCQALDARDKRMAERRK